MSNIYTRNKNDAFNVRCRVCEEWNSNEDSALIEERPDHKDNVWCCKLCSAKMMESLDRHCVFCGGWTVENLFVVDEKVIPVCWSCELNLE